MLRKIIAENRCEQQWQFMYDKGQFCHGLVIGLPSIDGPDYIVHLAVTPSSAEEPDELADEEKLTNTSSSSKDNASGDVEGSPSKKTPIEISVPDLVNHAMNALRMLPGCCYVLGLFTVEPKLPAGVAFQGQQKALRQLAAQLQANKWIYGSTDNYDAQDKLLLNYAGGDQAPRCTNVPLASGAAIAELTLSVEKLPIPWVTFYTQLDEPFEFRIARKLDGSADLEENVWDCMRGLSERLGSSRIFMEMDAGLNAPGVSVSSFLRLRNDKSDIVRTRLYFEVEDPIEGELYGATRQNGYIRCMGEVSSCVFAHPSHVIGDIDRYLKNDVLRSVSGRLRLFLDAYPDLPNDQRLHVLGRMQPPRRVYFWPFVGSRVQFSDYLFTEEDAKVVTVNAKQVFGVSIQEYGVNMKREKMRVPVASREFVADPELPKIVDNMLRGTNICCNMFCILTLAVIVIAVGFRFFLTEHLEDEHLLQHYL